ncbi:MAG: hypothetical protein ACE5ED_04180 [Rhodothalassiaceae bacterium]
MTAEDKRVTEKRTGQQMEGISAMPNKLINWALLGIFGYLWAYLIQNLAYLEGWGMVYALFTVLTAASVTVPSGEGAVDWIGDAFKAMIPVGIAFVAAVLVANVIAYFVENFAFETWGRPWAAAILALITTTLALGALKNATRD